MSFVRVPLAASASRLNSFRILMTQASLGSVNLLGVLNSIIALFLPADRDYQNYERAMERPDAAAVLRLQQACARIMK